MDTYTKYKNARNLTWKILTDNKLTDFPIDLKKLAARYRIKTHSFTAAEELLKTLNLKPAKEAFAFIHYGQAYIFYDDTAYKPRTYFSIGHELGHILSGHTVENRVKPYTIYEEEAANIFARSLLMPAIVCYIENLDTATKIAKFFGVSKQAAEIRAERIQELLKRNKFLTDGREALYYNLYLKNRF